MTATIMVVDDSVDEVIIVRRAVLKAAPGIELQTSNSGHEAVEYLRGCAQMRVLILLDLKMPGMDGVEVLHQIRAHARTRYIPVVMLTSSSLESDVLSAYEAGANGYVTKAHDFAEFTKDMGTVIHYWHDVNRSPK
jgi:two-component system, response regulator